MTLKEILKTINVPSFVTIEWLLTKCSRRSHRRSPLKVWHLVARPAVKIRQFQEHDLKGNPENYKRAKFCGNGVIFNEIIAKNPSKKPLLVTRLTVEIQNFQRDVQKENFENYKCAKFCDYRVILNEMLAKKPSKKPSESLTSCSQTNGKDTAVSRTWLERKSWKL